jgi:hypothetical protein
MTMQGYCVLYNTSSTAHKAISWTTFVAMDRSRAKMCAEYESTLCQAEYARRQVQRRQEECDARLEIQRVRIETEREQALGMLQLTAEKEKIKVWISNGFRKHFCYCSSFVNIFENEVNPGSSIPFCSSVTTNCAHESSHT